MKTTSWFLDEIGYAGGEHLDPNYVPVYDVKAGTNPDEDLTMLREFGLNDSHTLVDLGAGTGTFALAAAKICRQVVAVDVSPMMLNLLREKMAQAGIENVEAIQAGFLSYAHQGELADFVYSRHALHHLPDFWKALALKRIAAILKPGGVFYLRDLIFSFTLDEAEQVIDGWLANAADTPDKGWTRAELVTHLQDEYSTFSWLIEPMIEQAGFEIRRIDHGASGVHSAYVCVKW